MLLSTIWILVAPEEGIICKTFWGSENIILWSNQPVIVY